MSKAKPQAEIRDRIKELRRIKASDLLPNPANPRRHPEAQASAVAGILAEIGYADALLARETPDGLVLIDGHLRQKLTPDAIVPVLVLDVDEAEANLLLATIDPLSSLAEYDKESLDKLLHEVSTGDAALAQMLSGLAEENGLYFGEQPKREDDEESTGDLIDSAAELQKKWNVKTGDLFSIGAHRLLCGDCTNERDVLALMGNNTAVLMNTDPPYGIDYAAIKNGIPRSGFRNIQEKRGDIENDDLTDGPTLQAFLEAAIRTALPFLIENPAFYFWHPMLTQGTFFAAAAAAAADILIHRQIIWVKPHMVLTRSGQYHWQHELCFYGWIRGKPCVWHGDKSQTSVWNLGESQSGRLHPTQKPLELFRRPMANHSKQGEIVYEPFAGSGSQFLAAEETNRRCFGIEIEPKYCSVVLERALLAGLTPALIN